MDVLAGAWGGAAGAWRASGGEHWTDAKELRSRLAGVERRTKSRLRLVDEAAWRLAPSAAWPEGRRNFLVLFSVVYAFAAFVALFWVARRGGRATLAASVAGLGILFAALGWLMFPGGRISIVAHRFDYLNSDGSGATAELIFATALSPRDAELTFTRRVRPVFPDPRSAATAGVILEFATGGAVTVRGWDPEIGGVLCFASISDAPAPDVSLELLKRDLPFRVRVRSASELHDVELLVRRHNAAVGTLMGEAREIEIAEDGPAPRGPDFAFVSPRLHATDVDNFLFARPPLDAVYDGVFSPDLLDRRRASHYLVARFSDR